MEIGRFGVGASCVLLDARGHVLLVHQAYGSRLWAPPGGNAEPDEAPDAAARRELLEETGLRGDGMSLVGVYFEPDHERGPFLHFAFLVEWDAAEPPRADGIEIAEARLWPASALPRPHTELTARRIDDALAGRTGVIASVASRIVT